MAEPLGTLEIHTFRCFSSVWDRVGGYVRYNQDRWDNESHFTRCAIMAFMRELEQQGIIWNGRGRPKVRR